NARHRYRLHIVRTRGPADRRLLRKRRDRPAAGPEPSVHVHGGPGSGRRRARIRRRMKTPDLQRQIVAHLKALGRPETSRGLAARFLRIEHADEETSRRLLAPFLATVPGVVHHPEQGWSLRGKPAEGTEELLAEDGTPDERRTEASSEGLGDFVAL